MRRFFRIPLALAGLSGFLAVASTASAATLNVISPLDITTSVTYPPLSIQETINFSVSGKGFADLAGEGSYTGLSSITESVYKTSSSTPISVYHDTGALSPTIGSYINYFGGLYAGSYSAVISGIVTQSGATLKGTISTVPLPGAALLFGSAVAGLATLRSRRGRSSIA